jgi:DNA end-binding protein Ku
LRSLQRRTSPNMEIVRSVRLAEIDPVFFETSYYVVPDRGAERPYAILFEALKQTQHVALARVGMYGREHVVIVRPGEHGILAHTMFYTDEIRFENEFRANLEGVGSKELELAKAFLEAIEGPFAPEEFKDVYREELQAMITKKVSEAGAAPTVQQPAVTGPVVDILEALKKSIAMVRKSPDRRLSQHEKQPAARLRSRARGNPAKRVRSGMRASNRDTDWACGLEIQGLGRLGVPKTGATGIRSTRLYRRLLHRRRDQLVVLRSTTTGIGA